jgi:ketosteroid isomerase-like protein
VIEERVTEEHRNAALMRRLFAAFGRRDGAALAGMFSHDVVWRVGGETPMSGEYRGWRDVVVFLRGTTRETDGTYRSSLVWALGGDGRAAAVYRARGTRQGRELDIDQLLLCDIRDDRIVTATAIPFEAEAFTRFWS